VTVEVGRRLVGIPLEVAIDKRRHIPSYSLQSIWMQTDIQPPRVIDRGGCGMSRLPPSRALCTELNDSHSIRVATFEARAMRAESVNKVLCL
jgi:hypothetical protein